MRLLSLMLTELWEQHRLPTRMYHALFYAHQRGFYLPLTVGRFCQALRNPKEARLHMIPNVGPASIAHLCELFLVEDATSEQTARSCEQQLSTNPML